MKVKICLINPDECIDCGVCEPECPIDAIKADTDESVKDMNKWLLLNKSLQYGLIFQKSQWSNMRNIKISKINTKVISLINRGSNLKCLKRKK